MTRLLIDLGNSVWQLSWVNRGVDYAMEMNSLDAHSTVGLAVFSCHTASTRLQLSVSVDALILSAYTRLLKWASAYLIGSGLTFHIASCLAGGAELLDMERSLL